MMNNIDRMRHELKYYISRPEYEILRRRVSFLLKPDSNMRNSNGYTISSLYFDDFEDSAYYEKMDGVKIRKKYRIRIYNGDNRIIRLEKKSKNSSFINKKSSMLSLDEYYKIISGNAGSLIEQSGGVLHELYNEMLLKYMRPKVIVEYDREAYIGESSELRITFDKDLRVVYNSLDLFERSNANKFVLPEDVLILEVKFNSILPEVIRNILAMVDKHSLAISKYVLCRDKYDDVKEL